MEEHRLRPMPEGYNQQLFNELFEKTRNLRHKLARDIDHRRFGVTQDDIVSFFNTKFIYVFTKYYHQHTPDHLLGHIIKALQTFKFRVMKAAYIDKNSQSIISTEDVQVESPMEQVDKDFYYEKLMSFMRLHLSDNALMILELQLNPPPYILGKINPHKEANLLQKIPDEVLVEYLDLGFNDNSLKYILKLKKEIRNAISYAKVHFRASLQ